MDVAALVEVRGAEPPAVTRQEPQQFGHCLVPPVVPVPRTVLFSLFYGVTRY